MDNNEALILKVLNDHPYPVAWATTLLSGFHCRGCGKHQVPDEHGNHPDPDAAHRAHQAQHVAEALASVK